MGNKKLHIELLGKFRLRYNGTLITGVNRTRLQELLVYLLLHRNTPQPRRYLSFQFWPESTEKQARTNLRNVLHQLRKALPEHDQFILADNKTLQWNTSAAYHFDVTEFENATELANRAETNGDTFQQKSALNRAANLYKDHLFVTCYKKWIEPERKRLQQEYTQVLQALIRSLETDRAYGSAISCAKKLIEGDIYNEAGYRKLMKLYTLNEDRAKALQTYRTCAALFRKELDTDPSPQTRELYERLKSGFGPVTDADGSSENEWSFVGRHKEWKKLLESWKSVLSGNSAHFVALKGEAGIGKSRAGHELQHYLSRQGYQVVHTRSYASAGTVSYGMVADCLRAKPVFRQVKEMDTVWQKELVRLLPELKIAHPDLPDSEPIMEPWEHSRFLQAITKALIRDGKPKLLFLDDLQWCDSASLGWLDYLFHNSEPANVLIVGAIRSGEATDNHSLQQFISNLRPEGHVTEIPLRTFNKSETAELARQVTGQKINRNWEQLLHKETEGNPLFVIEFLRNEQFRDHFKEQLSATESEKIVDSPPLPQKVNNVIAARFQHLSDQAWELMGLAAAIGREFSFEILEQASGLQESELVKRLDELLRYHVIREKESEVFDFSHDKLRDVAYSEMSHAHIRWNHRRIAEALEEEYADNIEKFNGRLAFH